MDAAIRSVSYTHLDVYKRQVVSTLTLRYAKRMADILSHRGIKDPNEGLLEPKYRTVVNLSLIHI